MTDVTRQVLLLNKQSLSVVMSCLLDGQVIDTQWGGGRVYVCAGVCVLAFIYLCQETASFVYLFTRKLYYGQSTSVQPILTKESKRARTHARTRTHAHAHLLRSYTGFSALMNRPDGIIIRSLCQCLLVHVWSAEQR